MRCRRGQCQQGSGACHDWPLAPGRQDRRGRCCRCACGRNHPRPSCGERADDEEQMIATLKGLLDSKGTDHAIIDVQGVGYLVGASSRTLAARGRTGGACTVHPEMRASQNTIPTMGVAVAEQRAWIHLL